MTEIVAHSNSFRIEKRKTERRDAKRLAVRAGKSVIL